MKNTMMKGSLYGLVGGAALILAGCGASSDDGTTLVDKVSIPGTPTAISTSNQNTIVSETADSVDGAMAVGEIPVSAAVEGHNAPAFSIFDFASGRLLDYARQGLGQQQNIPAAISASLPVPCDSGTATMTFNVQNLNVNEPAATVLQPGDSFSANFSNCVDNTSGTTMNGGMSATLVSGTLVNGCGETAQGCGDVTLSMSFNDLQVSEMGVAGLADGGFTMAHDSTTNTNTVSGSDFYIYSSTGQGVHMSNFNIASTLSGNTETTTLSMTLASTRINGSVQIQTTTPLVTANVDTDDRPSSGALEITGASSKLTVTALDTTSVQLDLDESNDGSVDRTVTVTWTTIESMP